MTDYTPLDPDEGPTVWARQLKNNRYTVEIVEGTNPEDPLRSVELSHNEIDNLTDFVE